MSPLLMLLPIAGTMIAIVGFATLARWLMDRDRRRSPLAGKRIHLPGEHCRRQVASEEAALAEGVLQAIIAPFVLLAMWAAFRLDWPGLRLDAFDLVLGLALVAMLALAFIRIFRHASRRRRWLQGLHAELATAQELQKLSGAGCLVFHDFPGERFNIDHVVVGASAVYAVETKSRRKPAEKGKASARVVFDGARLKFPGFEETAPLDQARAQARWLAQFLAGAAGDPVRVLPVIALPGWYVEWTREGAQSELRVVNPKNVSFMAEARAGTLPGNLRRRIAHALQQRYPDFDERT